ncbi:hypothetical protein LTR36_003476 [Oleoguttula mirabilis]|uniref:Metallo-beta-lactamase domain-containing protein n=1 Tax=Oleoguttula mirabilis TaxID=1507867 RepID=A0AAV9JIQ5_9PEZI|nr:hypothetical protein LTR36_003476 [Oleoguttula mirabilis]
MAMSETSFQLPPAGEGQVYVTISALQGGHLTLPEALFITDAEPEKRATVPSLSFLIQHPHKHPSEQPPSMTRLIFDLGLKRDLTGYAPAQQHHILQRQPVNLKPDVAESLRAGGLHPTDIDDIVVSHVHWDHIGTPSDFPNSRFVVGAGTLHVLEHGGGPLYPANIFNKNEFPLDRTYELPPVDSSTATIAAKRQTEHQWRPLANFPAALDYFGDGSVWILDTPGHITGHVNLLARTGVRQWVYLGGDCCHDTRILRGESGIAMYDDGRGGQRSVHMDTDAAKTSLSRLRELIKHAKEDKIEVIIAHDKQWMERNPHKFFPGKL